MTAKITPAAPTARTASFARSVSIFSWVTRVPSTSATKSRMESWACSYATRTSGGAVTCSTTRTELGFVSTGSTLMEIRSCRGPPRSSDCDPAVIAQDNAVLPAPLRDPPGASDRGTMTACEVL